MDIIPIFILSLVPSHLGNAGFQLFKRHAAAFPPFQLSVFEKHQGGYGLDAVLLHQVGMSVDVYFCYADAVAHLLFQIVQYGMHALAGTTPCGIEVYQYEVVVLYQLFQRFFFHKCCF